MDLGTIIDRRCHDPPPPKRTLLIVCVHNIMGAGAVTAQERVETAMVKPPPKKKI